MGAVFIKRMEKEEGKLYVEKLEQDKIEDKKGKLNAREHYQALLADYKLLTK